VESAARGVHDRPEKVGPFDCPTQTSYYWSIVIFGVIVMVRRLLGEQVGFGRVHRKSILGER
jgi:hypothetical protein